MGAALSIIDETPTGTVVGRTTLFVASELITVRELIERRVRQEVRAFNERDTGGSFEGLVQPTETEADLNGYRSRKHRPIDADAQCAKALEAFERNGFLLLSNDRQFESLDETIHVGPDVEVSFVKLLPLVGG